jgi:methyltransferase (TIGR00027 family)
LIEQSQPKGARLFDDEVIKDLVGRPIRTMMRFAPMRSFTVRRADAVLDGLYGVQICRTRFIDEVVQASLSKGIGQLVILGAGFDTRPYRLPGVERVKVLELDLPAVQAEKRKKLLSHFAGLPKNVTFLPIDFANQSVEAVLAGTSFDPSNPAVFVWEGVSQYLSEESVRRTLAFVGKSALGSVLVFTYVLKSIIEGRSGIPGADRLMDVVAKNGAAWVFGLEPSNVASFLAPYHLDLIADVGNADYQRRYLGPRGRKLVVSECERVAHSIVTRS